MHVLSHGHTAKVLTHFSSDVERYLNPRNQEHAHRFAEEMLASWELGDCVQLHTEGLQTPGYIFIFVSLFGLLIRDLIKNVLETVAHILVKLPIKTGKLDCGLIGQVQLKCS